METYRPISENVFTAENIRNCQKHTFKIQRKLDNAVANDDKNKIREIVDLLAKKSLSTKIQAVWKITSVNKGKYTAGTDGVATPKEGRKEIDRFRLKLLNEINLNATPNPIKRIYIPKSNGKMRPLGIPTIRDRIVQEILRTAIEPIVEYHYHSNSYGFRPKRSCQDAQALLFKKLGRITSPKYVIEGDIKGCFDNINHNHIITTLDNWHIPKWIRNIISNMLETNIFYNGEILDNETGTPQGGVLSPMLANVVLTAFDYFCENNYGYKSYKKKFGTYTINPLVRYADDFIIVCQSKTQAETIKTEISTFLQKQIGLTLSDEKTKITHIADGFNFLGFNFRKYKPKDKNPTDKTKRQWSDYKLLIRPEKDKVNNFVRECKKIIDASKTARQGTIIRTLNPKIIGWGMYHRHVVSKKTFSYIDHKLWWHLYRWSKRRHPLKSKSWIILKYFSGKENGTKAIFKDKEENILLFRLAKIPIKRYNLVSSELRVFDNNPEVEEYWNRRDYINAFNQIQSIRLNKLYCRQKGICPRCDELITDTDIRNSKAQVHHIKPRSFGGNEGYSNLRLLHSECHKQLHSLIPRTKMNELADLKISYIQVKE